MTRENGLTSFSAIRLCVSPSTLLPLDVDRHPPALTAIPAPCVETSHMGWQDVQFDNIFPIVTKLKANAWKLTLKDAGILDEFNDIPVGLRQGFLCGFKNFSLAHTSISCNHYTSQDDEDFIIMKYAEEMELGRISHGYDPDILFSLIGHFCTAPLTVIHQGVVNTV